jgi:hypothetical protein
MKRSCIGVRSHSHTQGLPTAQNRHKTHALHAPDAMAPKLCATGAVQASGVLEGRTVRSKGLLSTRGALTASEMGRAASAPLKGVVVYSVEYTALGLAARPSSSDGVLPSPDPPCTQFTRSVR